MLPGSKLEIAASGETRLAAWLEASERRLFPAFPDAETGPLFLLYLYG
jgi:hypothetical protein